MIDFSQIPEWWPLCPNTQCSLATSCLRHQAFLQAPNGVATWTCLLPSVWKNEQSEGPSCRFYQEAKTVRMARGFQHICSQLKRHDAPQEFRETLTEYFGGVGNYYRYRKGASTSTSTSTNISSDPCKNISTLRKHYSRLWKHYSRLWKQYSGLWHLLPTACICLHSFLFAYIA